MFLLVPFPLFLIDMAVFVFCLINNYVNILETFSEGEDQILSFFE